MKDITLSIIIPSYRDPLLHPTIDSLLDNSGLGDALEIIVVLDGYTPEKPIKDDKRIKIISLGANVGMRDAINIGVKASRGEFIGRVDEHQMFGKNYDVILTRDCGKNEIVTARRYFLDPVQWKVMNIPYVDYCDLRICGQGDDRKFSGVTNERMAEERKDIMVDETFAMQGSCWVMRRSWWDKVIVELQTEGYGPHIQDSHEMVFKTWKAGGKLMVNKNTWHAHKHRDFPRTHNNGTLENPAHCTEGFKYSLGVWEDYFNELVNNKKINCYN
jgi:glycosyltransferase involved in cell wall biosynthesis